MKEEKTLCFPPKSLSYVSVLESTQILAVQIGPLQIKIEPYESDKNWRRQVMHGKNQRDSSVWDFEHYSISLSSFSSYTCQFSRHNNEEERNREGNFIAMKSDIARI